MKNKKLYITAFVLLAGFVSAIDASAGNFLRVIEGGIKGRMGKVLTARKAAFPGTVGANIKYGAKRATQVYLGIAAVTGAVVLDEYRRCMPNVPEGFALVDPSSKDPEVLIEWSPDTLTLPADKIIRDDIENIIRSCGYKAHYAINTVDRPSIKAAVSRSEFDKKKYFLKLEKNYVSKAREYSSFINFFGLLNSFTFGYAYKSLLQGLEKEYSEYKMTIFHEMGHVLFDHLTRRKKIVLFPLFLGEGSEIFIIPFIRSQENQADRFSYTQMHTLDLEYIQSRYKKDLPATQKKFTEKIKDFFSKRHPGYDSKVNMIQDELDTRTRKYRAGSIDSSLAVVSAENMIRAKQLWGSK